MEKTLENFGPCIVNDITGAEAEPEIAGVAARYRVPFIAMHMRGTPQNMQSRTHYDDLIGEIRGYFAAKTETLRSAGVEQIVLRSGIRFFKNRRSEFHAARPDGRNIPRHGASVFSRHLAQIDDLPDARHDAGTTR